MGVECRAQKHHLFAILLFINSFLTTTMLSLVNLVYLIVRIVDFASKIPLYFYLHKTVLFRILVIVGVIRKSTFFKNIKISIVINEFFDRVLLE